MLNAQQYEVTTLDNPKGALAVVLRTQLARTDEIIYIKVQLGNRNQAIGRSFHYSSRLE